MHANFIVSALFALAAVASASPAPTVTPAPVVRAADLDERGCTFFRRLFQQ